MDSRLSVLLDLFAEIDADRPEGTPPGAGLRALLTARPDLWLGLEGQKVALPWRLPGWGHERRAAFEGDLIGRVHAETLQAWVWLGSAEDVGTHDTLDEAKAAVDAVLLERGWVLL